MHSVVKYLEIANDFSPVWLDAGQKIAYIHHDGEGDHIWQCDLSTGERTRWTQEPIVTWQIYSDPLKGQLYFAMDQSGSECESIYRLSGPGLAPELLVEGGPARNLFAGVNAGPKIVAYASNKREAEHFDIWTRDLQSGEEKLIQAFEDNYNWPAQNAISPNGRYFLYNKLKAENDNALWLTDLVSGESRRVLASDKPSAEIQPCWKNDSSGFFFLSEAGSEFYQLYYYDLASQEASCQKSFEHDIENLALSGDDRYLCVIINEAGYSSLKIYDLASGQAHGRDSARALDQALDQDLAKAHGQALGPEVNTILPPKSVISPYSIISWSQEGHKLLFSLSSGSRPEGIWVLDLGRDSMVRLTDYGMERDLQASLVEPLLQSYQSFDGLKIDYWLYLPPGKQAAQLPCVIEIHGGPEGQERPTFNDFIQYLVSQGIAVVAPNVRGSTGYGKTFTHLDDVEKRLDSVRDIEYLVHHLIDSGIADRKSIGVSGTSYGGFMTLSCAGRLPDLFACAVDTVGMYNLVTFLENTADYRRPHRESEYGSLANHRDLLYEVSPIAKIDQITAPLMVIQGKNDPRVPVTESDQVVEHLRSLGKEIHYLCYEDEGHGIRKMKNRIDCYPQIAAFLKANLGIA